MKKYLAIIFCLAVSLSAATLEEIISQARASGNHNRVDIIRYLNKPAGYTVTISTNEIPKSSDWISVESNIIAELSALGIDGEQASNWDYIINKLTDAFDESEGNDAAEKQVLKSAVKMIAYFEKLKNITGQATLRADFGSTNAIEISQTRIALPSIAESNISRKVTWEDL